MNSNHNLVFLFSNWYSGATLLAILLNNHSKLVCNGETFPFQYDNNNKDVYICSCGQHIRQCDFFIKTTASFKAKSGDWNNNFRILPYISSFNILNKVICSFNPHFWLMHLLLAPGTPLRNRLNRYLDIHQEFYKQARSYYNDSACYIDGTKSIRRAELFIRYKQNKTKIIYLIRDGRGFCWSYLKNHNFSTDQLNTAAIAWQKYISMVDEFQRRYPHVEVLVVRYEDLCKKLENTLSEVCEFLGIEYDSTMISQPTNHHLFGNRMRTSFDGIVREDLSWMKSFTDNDVRALTELIKDDLTRFGYI